ncbi:YkgJ family cysteine cluster protein [Candidatus Bathyarchaeota archaeon]|nr:YkgJ family cysteine cluster protein [Candidatus Bathyarchaeota archaeon]
MQFVPWQRLANWKCIACGDCCRFYSVVLSFPEWLRIVENYGIEKTTSSINRLYIRRKENGLCPFLYNFAGLSVCGLQHMKPKACQLWPFKILPKPQYGHANEAAYDAFSNRFFIYADIACRGLRFGRPTWEFTNHVLKEFIEIALGSRSVQLKTTSALVFADSRRIFSPSYVVRRF